MYVTWIYLPYKPEQTPKSPSVQTTAQLIRNNFQSLPIRNTLILRVLRDVRVAWHKQSIKSMEWPQHLHISIPTFGFGIEISPAGGILDGHEWLLQVTQHGNHIVMDSASCIITLQKIWTFKQNILKTKTMSGALRQSEQVYIQRYREL